MFERRTNKVTAYLREQALRWLAWLARSLKDNNLSVFYVERMQPDWLPSHAERRVVAIMPILVTGLLFGLLFGLHYGGSAYLKHYVLRFLLWRNDYAPWNYIRFLDYAAERVFLRKVGGGYLFTHQLLMEYFAALPPTDQARQTKIT